MTPPENLTGDAAPLELDELDVMELRRLARSRPRSGRGAAAKAAAIRTLERLSRLGRGVPPPMPADRNPSPEFADLDEIFLERNPGVRERWWKTLWEEGRL
jgi:hypothetical protein